MPDKKPQPNHDITAVALLIDKSAAASIHYFNDVLDGNVHPDVAKVVAGAGDCTDPNASVAVFEAHGYLDLASTAEILRTRFPEMRLTYHPDFTGYADIRDRTWTTTEFRRFSREPMLYVTTDWLPSPLGATYRQFTDIVTEFMKKFEHEGMPMMNAEYIEAHLCSVDGMYEWPSYA